MVQIFAHRGSSGTHPENTLPAFAEAVRIGADGIELDIHLTKDEQIVVIHDEEVDRTTDGKGLVREKTLAEIKKVECRKVVQYRVSGNKSANFERGPASFLGNELSWNGNDRD